MVQDNLPDGFAVETCVVVFCRTCRCSYDEQDYVTVHFGNRDEAAQTITEAGWWVTEQGVQCPPCAAREACQTLGHAWPAWQRCRCGGRIFAHVRQMEFRTCASCGEGQERIAQTTSGGT